MEDDLLKHIRNVPDWPKSGIQFKDITTLCKVHTPFKESCDRIINKYIDKGITKVAAIEARGYVWGGVLAYQLGAGFVLMRKPGKKDGFLVSWNQWTAYPESGDIYVSFANADKYASQNTVHHFNLFELLNYKPTSK